MHVVKPRLDSILKSQCADAEGVEQALRKLALLDTGAIPLDLLTTPERKAVNLLQEHSLVTVDDMGHAAMHALTKLVLRRCLEQLTDKALNAMHAAIQNLVSENGGKELRQSRVFIVGDGRVGKTSLYRGLVGDNFKKDETSTVGAKEETFKLTSAHVEAQAQWDQVDNASHPRYHAKALARLEANRRKGNLESSAEDITSLFSVSQDKPVDSQNSPPLQASVPVEGEQVGAEKEWTGQDSQKARNAVVIETANETANENELKVNISTEVHAADAAKTRENEEAEEAPMLILDEGLVLKYMNEKSEPIILSVWDFGGQSRFYALHLLFLSCLGVYLICFNMVDVLDEKKRQEAIKFIRFWIQTVSAHTVGDNGMIAPVILVGTHKDKVPTPADHKKISQILKEELQHCDAWKHVKKKQMKEKDNLNFFPVDNTSGQKDEVVTALMCEIRDSVEGQEYMTRKVPLTWLALFDDLLHEASKTTTINLKDGKSEKKYMNTSITLKDVESRAQRCELGNHDEKLTLEAEVQCFLKYFAGLGFIMYSDEKRLRDLVILRPVEFLIPPATKIICDFGIHMTDEHEVAEAMHVKEWIKLRDQAVLKRNLLPVLWQEFDSDRRDDLENILVKYSLQIPLIDSSKLISSLQAIEESNDSKFDHEYEYLVPAILPQKSEATRQDLLIFVSE